MIWLRGRPAMRHIVLFTSVMAIDSSTVTRPSTEASTKPRLYACSSARWVCRRAWSVMSRALAKMPRADRKSVVEGKRVDLGGRRIIKKKKNKMTAEDREQ